MDSGAWLVYQKGWKSGRRKASTGFRPKGARGMSNVETLNPATGDRFHPDPERSYTLEARYYIEPEIYEREKAAIFYRGWSFACHAGQVSEPGAYTEFRAADQNLFAIRGKDGKLRAFYNVCSHRAHELVRGSGTKTVITCPYHAWSYHADGRLRSARGSEKVAGFDAEEFCLKQVQLEEIAGFVFVNLDPEAPSLASQTQGLEAEMRRYCPEIDKLKFAYRLTYEIEANWKNVVDNYLECYHCATAHPAFADLVDISKYRSVTYGIHSSHIAPAGRADNTAYSFDGGDGTPNSFAGWWLWPNLTLNIFPGPPNITTLHIIPTGPETTLEHFDFYFLESEPSAGEREAIEYMDKVLQPEDIGLVESVQRGLHSRGYRQGRFMVDAARSHLSEHAVHHFHNLVMNALRT